MLLPILEFQNRKYLLSDGVDAGKIVSLLAQLAAEEVQAAYSGKSHLYDYTIQPTHEVEVSLTYVDSSRVKFPTPPPTTAIEATSAHVP